MVAGLEAARRPDQPPTIRALASNSSSRRVIRKHCLKTGPFHSEKATPNLVPIVKMSPTREKQRRASVTQLNDPPAAPEANPRSQVVDYYKGRCVLVTGASGFLGKLIIEKLLRTCTEIKKIFVLIRPKRNKTAVERLDDLFSSIIFERLKWECDQANSGRSFQQLTSKVVVLQGSLEAPLLGLNIERLLQLADEVSVIIHSAAIVSFVGKLRLSTEVNVLGTYNVLELATKLPKLGAFIHVSTCYSNCTRKQVDELIYPVELEPERLLELTRQLDDWSLERMRAQLVGKHPNNYTYTKQLAEFLCGQFAVGAHQLPVLICRPSIIVATYEEPIKAFVDNRNAGNGILNGVSQGLLQVVQGRHETVMDLIPADFVANCAISLAWFADHYHRVRRRRDSPLAWPQSMTRIEDAQLEQKMVEYYLERRARAQALADEVKLEDKRLALVPVVHVSSGVENPVTFYGMMQLVAKHTLELPSWDLFRWPAASMTASHSLYRLATFFNQRLVGRLMDRFCAPPRAQMVAGGVRGARRPLAWSEHFEKCDKLIRVLPYFFLNSFQFEPSSRLKLIEVFMNETDRKLFNCDVRRLEWNSYARDITLGIRRHLIGESDGSIEEARDKFRATLRRNALIKFLFILLVGLLLALICLMPTKFK